MLHNKSNTYKILTVIVVLLISVTITFLLYQVKQQLSGERLMKSTQDRVQNQTDAYYLSLLRGDPKPLQNLLIADLKNGTNDKFTKSAAYFITHRFFDNGGNIYEIYDYIYANPELAFLKEAEKIYPNIFDQIKKRTLPSTYVDRSYYAYLAYVEILHKYGYSDIAALGTVANQYAKLAYNNTTIAKEMPPEEGKIRSKNAKRDVKKALQFIKAASNEVDRIIKGEVTSEQVVERDILVGLNQYGASLRYLEALGVNATSSKNTSKEIFEFTMSYSSRHVPELYVFTGLLNASTLAILNNSSDDEIKIALYPLLDLDLKKIKLIDNSIVHKVLDSRFEVKPKNIGETYMDMYSKRNTLRLANRVPEFKNWLILNGWQDSDFKQ